MTGGATHIRAHCSAAHVRQIPHAKAFLQQASHAATPARSTRHDGARRHKHTWTIPRIAHEESQQSSYRYIQERRGWFGAVGGRRITSTTAAKCSAVSTGNPAMREAGRPCVLLQYKHSQVAARPTAEEDGAVLEELHCRAFAVLFEVAAGRGGHGRSMLHAPKGNKGAGWLRSEWRVEEMAHAQRSSRVQASFGPSVRGNMAPSNSRASASAHSTTSRLIAAVFVADVEEL